MRYAVLAAVCLLGCSEASTRCENAECVAPSDDAPAPTDEAPTDDDAPPVAVCGDGIVQAPEACDDGPANSDIYAAGSGRCNASCTGEGPHCPVASLEVPSEHATIMAALAVAGPGDTICLAPGTYTENVVITTQVTLVGFAGASATIIDGSGIDSVVRISGGATLEGLTIQNGLGYLQDDTRAGGGIFASGGALSIRDVLLQHNTVDAPDKNTVGGGLHVRDVALHIADSTVLGNRLQGNALNLGAGIAITGASEAVIERVRVLGNDATGLSGYGGGIYVGDSSSVLITNIVIAGNSAGFGGAIYSNGTGEHVLTNLTVARNISAGPVVAMYYSAFAANMLVLANTSDSLIVELIGSTNIFGYSNVTGNVTADTVNASSTVGENGIISAPETIDLASTDSSLWDFHLPTGSPSIDAGYPGLRDPDGTRSDIGAYGGPGGGW